MILRRWYFYFPGEIWQYMETSLAITKGEEGVAGI